MKSKPFGKLTPVVDTFLYRNQLTICAGGPYAGKSRLSMHLANALASGEETFLGKFAPIKVLYCSERDWDFNSEQLRTVGHEELPDNLRFFCVPDIPPADVPSFESSPLEYIAQKAFEPDWKPDLVTFDTAPHFQPVMAHGESVNSYSFNRKELLRMKRWATKYYLSAFVLYHSPKQNEKSTYQDPFDRILGSTAILASSVAVAILERLDDHELRVHFKSHVAVMKSPRSLSYKDFSELNSSSIPSGLMEVGPTETFVLQAINEGDFEDYLPLSDLVTAIATTTRKSKNQARNVVVSLIKKGLVDFRVDEFTGAKYIRKKKPS